VWSESIGASAARVVFRHILPNAMAPVLVAMTLVNIVPYELSRNTATAATPRCI
jgi:ABC-type microcin C transport system permease subunit YejE